MPEQSVNRVCIEPACRQPFEIDDKEQAYFERHDLKQPKRCKPCRAKRKAAAEAEQQAQ